MAEFSSDTVGLRRIRTCLTCTTPLICLTPTPRVLGRQALRVADWSESPVCAIGPRRHHCYDGHSQASG
jgi:hypothetical protein